MSFPAVAVAALLTSSATAVSAQTVEPPASPFVVDFIRRVVLDPTTYASGLRIERMAAASYLSYVMSAMHFRQWRKNERLARQLGFD